MAKKIAIVGLPNTGKSYSRKFIEKGEEVFIISPSHKNLYITDSNGEPLKPLIKKDGKYISGNYIINNDIHKLSSILDFVSKIEKIKVIILPDFTHFVTKVLANPSFIRRKSGGEAFQRFWELASDIMINFFFKVDELRPDLTLISEYHSVYDEEAETFKIFIPGGKMVEEKFLIDSYFDIMLYTHIDIDKTNNTVKSYNFVTKRWGKYSARDQNLFEDILIPNNLQLVLDKLKNIS